MPFSNAYGGALVSNLFNGVAIPANYTGTNLYLALHTADPGVSGTQTTSEISYTSYARLSVVRNTTGGWTVSGKVASNTAAATFAASTGGTGGTVTHLSIGELATGAGALLFAGPVTPNITVSSGVQPNFPIGQIVVTYT